MHAHPPYLPDKMSAVWSNHFSLDQSGFGLLALSFSLHALFFLLLLWLPFSPLMEAEDEEEIPVTFVTLEKPPSPPAPPSAIAQMAPAGIASSTEPTAPIAEENGMIRPAKMLSGSTLAQDNNQKARLALSEVTADERLDQLCTLEAMEQIQAYDQALTPDLLLSYPFEEVAMKGNQLIARGAAFFAQQKWYHLSYECDLAANGANVTAFAFKIGEPVPRRMWESHNLVEMVTDSVEDVERYNDKTRSEHPNAGQQN